MFKNMQEIRELNESTGHYFFSEDTMAFFNSIVYPELFGGQYFVTSEKQTGWTKTYPRLYTVRKANEDGTIDTVGPFNEYKTKAQAVKAAALLASNQASLEEVRQ